MQISGSNLVQIVKINSSLLIFYTPLAQLVEHSAHNRVVVGPNPARCIFLLNRKWFYFMTVLILGGAGYE